ncbi:hypothetical protein YC2023_099242 [Brassica napus]
MFSSIFFSKQERFGHNSMSIGMGDDDEEWVMMMKNERNDGDEEMEKGHGDEERGERVGNKEGER